MGCQMYSACSLALYEKALRLSPTARGDYEAGKIVAAVCHGPIVFANVVLSDETKLLAGKECTGFTNREEAKMGKTDVVAKSDTCPGSCEDAMGEAGGV